MEVSVGIGMVIREWDKDDKLKKKTLIVTLKTNLGQPMF